MPLIGLVLVTGGGWYSHWTVGQTLRNRLAAQLDTMLDANMTALRIWAKDQRAVAEVSAIDPGVRPAVKELLQLSLRPEVSDEHLEASSVLARLRASLAPVIERHRYRGFIVLDRGFRIIGADSKDLVGQPLPAATAAVLRDCFDGETLVTRPFPGQALGGKGDTARLMAATAVTDETGKRIAILGLRIRPRDDFSRILSVAQMGRTGETFAFDKSGLMLSRSRFEDELRAIGMLPDDEEVTSIFRISVRDPGKNLLKSEADLGDPDSLMMTVAVRDAVAGRRGLNVEGFRDYRGVEVIGAWTWMPEFAFGVVTKVDAAEAFEPLDSLRRIVWILTGLLVASFGLMTWESISVRRLRRSVAEARQLGQYTLGNKIGEGGMGSVYRASHALLRRPTAIKLLSGTSFSREATTRFEREVQLTSTLRHPNTVQIYDYGITPEGVFYYAMEFLEGITLEKLVQRYGPLPPARVIQILRKALGSLEEAHGIGFIHRDIKPTNVMLCQQGGVSDQVKVLDFGLVKNLDGKATATLTAKHAVAGTPQYIAPECIMEEGKLDARVDVYCIGGTAYFLLTGSPPFRHDSIMGLLNAHVTLAPDSPSKRLGRPLPEDLERVVMSALAKDPDERPRTARAMRKMLDACADAGGWGESEADEWWQAHRGDFLSDENSEHSRTAGPRDSTTFWIDT